MLVISNRQLKKKASTSQAKNRLCTRRFKVAVAYSKLEEFYRLVRSRREVCSSGKVRQIKKKVYSLSAKEILSQEASIEKVIIRNRLRNSSTLLLSVEYTQIFPRYPGEKR